MNTDKEQTPTASVSLRERFEKWCGDQGSVHYQLPTDRDGNGYEHPTTDSAWLGWQAAQSRQGQCVEGLTPENWRWKSGDDKPLPEDDEIESVHPMSDLADEGKFKRYENALRLVGARHSKYGLVNLVNWLLYKVETKTAVKGPGVLEGPDVDADGISHKGLMAATDALLKILPSPQETNRLIAARKSETATKGLVECLEAQLQLCREELGYLEHRLNEGEPLTIWTNEKRDSIEMIEKALREYRESSKE